MYCHGDHTFEKVFEDGFTPYLKCKCGKVELIPGAQVYTKPVHDKQYEIKFVIALTPIVMFIILSVMYFLGMV